VNPFVPAAEAQGGMASLLLAKGGSSLKKPGLRECFESQ
jgi:hypothetical protein